DLTVAFEDGERDIADIGDVAMQTQIFVQIMFTETITGSHRVVDVPVANDDIAAALDEQSKSMGPSRPVGQDPVKQDQHEAAAERREQRRRSVDRSSQHRRQDEPEHGIKRCFLRQEAPVTAADYCQRRYEYDYAS